MVIIVQLVVFALLTVWFLLSSGLSGSVQLGVGAGVWTRQAVAVNGCGVWNDVLNVDVPIDDRLKLSLRGDTMVWLCSFRLRVERVVYLW